MRKDFKQILAAAKAKAEGVTTDSRIKTESDDKFATAFHKLMSDYIADMLPMGLPGEIVFRNQFVRRSPDDDIQWGAEVVIPMGEPFLSAEAGVVADISPSLKPDLTWDDWYVYVGVQVAGVASTLEDALAEAFKNPMVVSSGSEAR